MRLSNIFNRMEKYSLALVLFLVLTSCEHKDLCFHHPHDALVRVDVNWSRFQEEVPTGMSVMVYSEDSETGPRTLLSNETSYVTANLPAGRYKTLVYNQSPTEFGSLSFFGLDRFHTARVEGVKTTSRWYYTRTEGEVVIVAPEWIASDSETDVVVTEEMVKGTDEMKINQSRSRYDRAYLISQLTPLNFIVTLNVKVNIKGIYNFRSARASIDGLGKGCYLATREALPTKATQLLESWKVTVDPVDPTRGYITSSITCFGLPAGHQGLAEENNLILDILLVDNKTVLNFPFQVGDAFIKGSDGDTEQRVTLSLNLEVDLDSPLPDVEPDGGSGSGFDATVDDWGEEENIDIQM